MKINKLMVLYFCLIPTMVTHIVAANETGVFPVLFRVGPEAACDFSNLQDAINAASNNGPENDFIRLSKNHTNTAVAISINDQSITIQGGYDSCFASGPSGRTVIDGSGGSLQSVFFINGEQHAVVFRNLIIRGGEDDGNGGGIDILGSSSLRLESTTVENNSSALGGGISIRGSEVIITELSSIASNTANDQGGGIYCDNGLVSLIGGSSVLFNEANTGGGVALDGNCELRHLSRGLLSGINANDASFGGGGIFATEESKVVLVGDLNGPANVFGNHARAGGGIFLEENAELRARNAAINDNSAVSLGGGLYANNLNTNILIEQTNQNCQTNKCSSVSNNTAGSAAALYIFGAGEAAIKKTYIENNFTGSSGGHVIHASRPGLNLTMEGNVISGNNGQHIINVVNGANALLAFITMTNNLATFDINTKQGKFADGNKLEIYSSILWEPKTSGLQLLNYNAANTEVIVNCLLVNETASLPAGGFISIQNPQFVNPLASSGDYHLQPTSPAIDYCDSTIYQPSSHDIDQQNRGVDEPTVVDNFPNSWFDIGADEWYAPDLIFADGFE